MIVNVVYLCVSWKIFVALEINACFKSEKNITVTKEKPKNKEICLGSKRDYLRINFSPLFAESKKLWSLERNQTDFRFSIWIKHEYFTMWMVRVYCIYYSYIFLDSTIYKVSVSMTVLAGYLDMQYNILKTFIIIKPFWIRQPL